MWRFAVCTHLLRLHSLGCISTILYMYSISWSKPINRALQCLIIVTWKVRRGRRYNLHFNSMTSHDLILQSSWEKIMEKWKTLMDHETVNKFTLFTQRSSDFPWLFNGLRSRRSLGFYPPGIEQKSLREGLALGSSHSSFTTTGADKSRSQMVGLVWKQTWAPALQPNFSWRILTFSPSCSGLHLKMLTFFYNSSFLWPCEPIANWFKPQLVWNTPVGSVETSSLGLPVQAPIRVGSGLELGTLLPSISYWSAFYLSNSTGCLYSFVISGCQGGTYPQLVWWPCECWRARCGGCCVPGFWRHRKCTA